MTDQPYDFIGDIHGQFHKLTALLTRLGYKLRETACTSTWHHPAGRRVIFLGDYLDRGPAVREVLHTVRSMVDAGDALAILGNHELNAVLYHTPNGWGGHLREHTMTTTKGHATTLEAFGDREAEWATWVEWMKDLPMFLDLGSVRAVHACWDSPSVERLCGASLRDHEFLRASAAKGTSEFNAIRTILNGPELALPHGMTFYDPSGRERTVARVRWWGVIEGMPLGDIVLPLALPSIRYPLCQCIARSIPSYASNGPPVFFGHYWLPPQEAIAPLAPNIACLDFSAAFADNPLVAYRWDGEAHLSTDKFVLSGSDQSCLSGRWKTDQPSLAA